jgi:membrane protein YdbS with pleckstrin-like domain
MTQIYCRNCGKLIRASSNFCQFCGTAQHGEAAMSQKIAKPHEPRYATNDSIIDPEQCIDKRRLCQRAVWSFFLSYIGKTNLLLLLFLIGVAFEPLLFGSVLTAYVLLLYVVAVIVRQNYYFEVNTSSFRKEHGVIHKIDVTIPFNRIQNVNVTRSLGDRILGLARIDIESAGSSHTNTENKVGSSDSLAEGHLPGVTLAQAEEIHDLLLDRFSKIQNTNQRTSP